MEFTVGTKIRYCRNCECDIRHDIITYDDITHQHIGIGERLFLGIVTFGFNEMIVSKGYECQCCGMRTKKRN